MVSVQQIFECKQHLIARRVGDEVILVPVRSSVSGMNRIFTLNEVGAFIFDDINGLNSAADIARHVSEAFDVDINTAMTDLQDFLNKLFAFIHE